MRWPLDSARQPREPIPRLPLNADPRTADLPLVSLQGEDSALGPYLRAVRRHWPIVVVVTLAAVVGVVGWLLLRSPTYEARAQILVTPLPPGTLLPLTAVVRDSGDPTRTMQTAATLIDSQDTARIVAQSLGPGWSAGRVQQTVEVVPLGESNILTVTAEAEAPAVAARVANSFAETALRARRAALEQDLATAIAKAQDQRQMFAGTDSGPPSVLDERLTELRSLQNSKDPTLSLLDRARASASPAGPPPWLLVVLAVLAGLALGSFAALLMHVLGRGADRSSGAPAERQPEMAGSTDPRALWRADRGE